MEVRGQLRGVGSLLTLYMGSRNQTLVIDLYDKWLYLLSHLTTYLRLLPNPLLETASHVFQDGLEF